MSGNKLGAIKAQTGFGTKDYKPGSMIAKMNSKNPSLKVKNLKKGLLAKNATKK